MILEIKDRPGMTFDGPTPSLTHFFAVLELTLLDNDIDRHPYDLENVLMVFIRGLDMDNVPCRRNYSQTQCLLHQDFSIQRVPSWDILFSAMRIMGGMRQLSSTTRRAMESSLRNIFVVPRHISGNFRNNSDMLGDEHNILDCRESHVMKSSGNTPITVPLFSSPESDVKDLMVQVHLDLALSL
jgi:hypothetical protein